MREIVTDLNFFERWSSNFFPKTVGPELLDKKKKKQSFLYTEWQGSVAFRLLLPKQGRKEAEEQTEQNSGFVRTLGGNCGLITNYTN